MYNGRHLTVTYGVKAYVWHNALWHKTMRLLCEMYGLRVFLIIDKCHMYWLLLDTTCISKRDFVSSARMCFGGVALAMDTVFQYLKYYRDLLKFG